MFKNFYVYKKLLYIKFEKNLKKYLVLEKLLKKMSKYNKDYKNQALESI